MYHDTMGMSQRRTAGFTDSEQMFHTNGKITLGLYRLHGLDLRSTSRPDLILFSPTCKSHPQPITYSTPISTTKPMNSSPSIEHGRYSEKGGKIDVNAKLAEEVYGAGALSGEVDKFSSWGLKLRAFVGKFGAEEGGIERVPPEARTDQHPRDLFFFFSSGNCCITTLGRIPTLPSSRTSRANHSNKLLVFWVQQAST